ncbi:MAG TPA: Gfo/Idh/MocA family oxidoreductase [Glaciibacter sp.]|nr:Gfo/Idh/MocA family oxidoreductase [Glaciibacter sp.]
MPQQLSVAVLGFWHVHAAEYAQAAAEHPDTQVAAVWDDDACRGRDAARELGVPFVDDLDALLARDDIDAVIVTTATNLHRDVMVKAANARKHIFTEKLLAPTVSECHEILDAVEANGVKLVVSLPRLHEATTVTARRLVDDGKLGDLTYARVRMAHDGWLAGWLPERFADPVAATGGALADLGCHPAYLTQLFLGYVPATVSASYTSVTGRDVEDNAVVTATYPNGAIGVFEASFVTTPGAGTLELRGTEGALLHGFGSDRLMVKGSHFDPENWQEVPLREPEPAPFTQWVEHIRADTVATDNLHAAVELTRLIAAANDSAMSHATLPFASASSAASA